VAFLLLAADTGHNSLIESSLQREVTRR